MLPGQQVTNNIIDWNAVGIIMPLVAAGKERAGVAVIEPHASARSSAMDRDDLFFVAAGKHRGPFLGREIPPLVKTGAIFQDAVLLDEQGRAWTVQDVLAACTVPPQQSPPPPPQFPPLGNTIADARVPAPTTPKRPKFASVLKHISWLTVVILAATAVRLLNGCRENKAQRALREVHKAHQRAVEAERNLPAVPKNDGGGAP